MRIDLFKRDCIAGLRRGIEGMRVGGRRKVTISPHLAYGRQGVPGLIPPDAVLKCEIELLEVYERDAKTPLDFPPGRHLYVFCPGEAAQNKPRWQFGLDEDGRCGVLITHAIGGTRWRRAPIHSVEAQLDPDTTRELFEAALALPTRSPQECLGQDDLWSDRTEAPNAVTRDRQANALCVTVYVAEQGQYLCYFSLREISDTWQATPLHAVISSLLARERSRK